MSAKKIITWTVFASILVGSLLGRKEQNQKMLGTVKEKLGQTKDFVRNLMHKV